MLPEMARTVCLSPVKLYHYFSVTGDFDDGSEAVFR